MMVPLATMSVRCVDLVGYPSGEYVDRQSFSTHSQPTSTFRTVAMSLPRDLPHGRLFQITTHARPVVLSNADSRRFPRGRRQERWK
jgi:hypothetical protein